MLDKKLSYTLAVVLIIVSCGCTYLINEFLHHRIHEMANETIAEVDLRSGIGHNKEERLKGFRLVKPLVSSEEETESPNYSLIKSKLLKYIEQLKKQDKLISASVYLKDFDHGEWMSINDKETYYPGSLIKVPGLITYLKMAQKNPGLLDKNLVFENSNVTIPNQTFPSKQIIPGKPYTIRELLKYMISYSDNNATYLLNRNVDLAVFRKLFVDLDIPVFTKTYSKITARNFSNFLGVLFNGTYLSAEESEFALELLEESDFKIGLTKGLPVNTVVAHKFGEMGDATSRQLHESGLVYINNSPYLLTIMTKGYDVKDLPSIISTMSKMVYQDFIRKEAN